MSVKSVSVEKKDSKTAEFVIEVETSLFDEGMDHAYKKVVKQVNVPGFRKGKVPRAMLEKMYGREVLFEEAVEYVLPISYEAALGEKESEVEVVGRPEIDIVQLEDGKPFIYKVTVEIKPDFELGEYKGLELAAEEAAVEDSEVESKLEELRNRHAEMETLTEGAVENGDVTIIDFKGKKDGVPFEGGTAEKYSLEIGSGSFIPGFEEQMIGLEIGGEKEIGVTFPEEYHQEDLAGQDVVFEIKLHGINRKKLSDLNDEFAADVSEFKTLEELREDIGKTILKEKKEDIENELRKEAVEKAAANTEIDIPESMIEGQIDNMVEDFAVRIGAQGISLEQYLGYLGEEMDSFRDKYREGAEKAVKEKLVLDAIAEKEGVEVSREEVDAEIAKVAEIYNRTVEEVTEMLNAQGQMDQFKGSMKSQKAIEVIIENSAE